LSNPEVLWIYLELPKIHNNHKFDIIKREYDLKFDFPASKALEIGHYIEHFIVRI